MKVSSLVFDDIPLVFDIGRVARHKLDHLFIKPKPLPPTRKVTIWGGVEEDEFVYDDPTYVDAIGKYRRSIYAEEQQLFNSAIMFDYAKALTVVDLELLALTDNMLVSLLSKDDINILYDEVMYNSTVTDRGLGNAFNMFNVRRYGEPIKQIKLPNNPVEYSIQFRDMSVAKELGYTWKEFSELSGQEQSDLVMYSTLSSLLTYLEANKQ